MTNDEIMWFNLVIWASVLGDIVLNVYILAHLRKAGIIK